jgi:hypothetical protein
LTEATDAVRLPSVVPGVGRTLLATAGVVGLFAAVSLVARSQEPDRLQQVGSSLTERQITVVLNAGLGDDGRCSAPEEPSREPLPSVLEPLDPVGACYRYAEVDRRNRVRWSFTAPALPDGTTEVPGVVALRDGTALLANGAVFAAEPEQIEVRCGTGDDVPELATVVADRQVLRAFVDPATLRIVAVSCALTG